MDIVGHKSEIKLFLGYGKTGNEYLGQKKGDLTLIHLICVTYLFSTDWNDLVNALTYIEDSNPRLTLEKEDSTLFTCLVCRREDILLTLPSVKISQSILYVIQDYYTN